MTKGCPHAPSQNGSRIRRACTWPAFLLSSATDSIWPTGAQYPELRSMHFGVPVQNASAEALSADVYSAADEGQERLHRARVRQRAFAYRLLHRDAGKDPLHRHLALLVVEGAWHLGYRTYLVRHVPRRELAADTRLQLGGDGVELGALAQHDEEQQPSLDTSGR